MLRLILTNQQENIKLGLSLFRIYQAAGKLAIDI